MISRVLAKKANVLACLRTNSVKLSERQYAELTGDVPDINDIYPRERLKRLRERTTWGDEEAEREEERRRERRHLNPHARMEIHSVPPEERATDENGNLLPWGYIYAE